MAYSNLIDPAGLGGLPRTHFLDYWRIIYKRRWAVFACTFICIITALIADSFKKPTYQCTATILIDERRNSFVLPNQPYTYEDYYQKQRAFETHFKVIKSYPLIQMVVKRLDLDNYLQNKPQPPTGILQLVWNKLHLGASSVNRFLTRLFSSGKNPEEKTAVAKDIPRPDPLVLSVQSMVEIVPVLETNLVKINVQHPDPWVTVNIANTLAEVYQEHIIKQQLNVVKDNLHWMTQEAFKLKANIQESEQSLHKYREKSNLLETHQEDTLQAGELAQLRQDHNRTKAQRIEIEARLAELRKVIDGGANYIPAFIKSDLLENIASQRVAARLESERLLKRYKHKHPKIIAIRSRINMLKQQFVEEIKKTLAGANSEYLVLVRKEKQHEETLKQYTEKVIQDDRHKIQYTLLERDAEANQELYNILMRQLKSINMAESIQNRTINIIERARLPEYPVQINKMVSLLVSLLLGLALGIGLAFFLDYLDCTITDVEDVKESLGLPVLGVIPSFDRA